jgi:hypothetical protein
MTGFPQAAARVARFRAARATLGRVKDFPVRLAKAAIFQEHVLTAAQLLDGGLSQDFLRSQVDQGHWQRLYRGVYATFSGEPQRPAQLWAAVLAAGPGAMLSHETAAEIGGLLDKPSRLIHLTLPSRRWIAPMPGLTIHYSGRAEQAQHPARQPPRTTMHETVLDLATTAASLDDAIAWVTRALGRSLTSQADLRSALDLRGKIRWRCELTQMLSPEAAGLHSILEYRYDHDVERPHHLPDGTRQARFSQGGHTGYRDRLYEAYLVAVELDGRSTHPIEDRWQDISRDNAAATDGILTLRYGWLDVTQRPCRVAAEVARVLAKRGYAGARPCSPDCPVRRVPDPSRPSA